MRQKNERLLVVTKNNKGKTFAIPTKQRALILQGGGALGYYEIGVLESIYKKIVKKSSTKKSDEMTEKNRALQNHANQSIQTTQKVDETYDEPLFDIVAGVSIGAINAVFLVDYVLKNHGNWDGSVSELKNFWKSFEAKTNADSQMFRSAWEGWRFFNPNLASTESARRYWSFFQLACCTSPFGGSSPNLCNSSLQLDYRYLSPFNTFFSYNYEPLMTLMKNNINYPIKTHFEKNQPRLLLLSVDVKDCSTPVTFDSYPTYKKVCDVCGQELENNKLLADHIKEHVIEVPESRGNAVESGIPVKSITAVGERNINPNNGLNDHIWTSVYGDEYGNGRKHVVSYNGIDNDILMASCLFPYSSHHTSLYDLITREQRTFWDGAFLSNTPLRELLQNHKDFWVSYFEANDIDYDKIVEDEYKIYQSNRQDSTGTKPKIPDLEVFIVNLYPALETKDAAIPSNKDKIEDRMNDIRFQDRSKYDEKVAHLVTDYVDLTRRLIKLAEDKGKVSKEDIKAVLEIKGESTKRDVKQKRSLLSLIEDKFRVKVYRIDRQDDKDTILGKASDFTPTTLKELYAEGVRDADDWFTNHYREWEIEI